MAVQKEKLQGCW